MPLPKPEPGLVISYAYLWRHEKEDGQVEGRKDRPCVIVSAAPVENAIQITVIPVTHAPPHETGDAVEIPPRVKQHLGLDMERSWAVIREANQFNWPGFDLRPVHGKKGRYDYGFLPPLLLEKIKSRMLDLFLARRQHPVKRD